MCLLSSDQLPQKHPLNPFLIGALTDARLHREVGNMFDSRARGPVQYLIRPHTLVSSSTDSRMSVVSYWQSTA